MSSTYFWNQRQCSFTRAAHRNAVGDGGRRAESHGLAFGDGDFHRRQARRLHAENLDLGIDLFHRDGDATDQASAADGADDGFDVGMLSQNFQADRSLPGDDRVVIEGVNKCQIVALAAARGFFAGFVVVRAVEHNFAAEILGGRNFGERRGQRHHNLRADAVPSGMVGQALRMVAGRGGNHSAGALFVGEREQPVERAAFFVGAGTLQVIELEIDRVSGRLRKSFRLGAGRKIDRAVDALGGGLYV